MIPAPFKVVLDACVLYPFTLRDVLLQLKAGAQIIVTSNKRDFYDLPSGIEVQTPDEFLSNLFDLAPARMVGVLETLARRYKNPPMELQRILDALALTEFGELVLRASHDLAP